VSEEWKSTRKKIKRLIGRGHGNGHWEEKQKSGADREDILVFAHRPTYQVALTSVANLREWANVK